jgi:hypothetical protein
MGSVGTNKAVVYAKPGAAETEVRLPEIPERADGQIRVRM